MLIAFLAIPKTEKRYANDPIFRQFRRNLFHRSLSAILSPLRNAMSKPEVAQCSDGHYRRTIYGLGPYIADYMEQVVVTNIVQGWCVTCPTRRQDLEDFCEGLNVRSRKHSELLFEALDAKVLWNDYGIVSDVEPFTNDFPRADIYQLMSGDLLHQIIKGCFKDHLVDWINEYLKLEHGEARASEIIDQIDRRITAVPHFSGLRNFKQGRDFKQWTGDDSKGLMKVYLPAVISFIPPDMTRALSSFIEFCYLVRRSVISEEDVGRISDCLRRYHQFREIFRTSGVRPDGFSSLPRQHSADHYVDHIRNFGAPNGLCSSITESKHIRAVKEPWRRSSKNNALARGMLEGTCLSAALRAVALADEGSENDEWDAEDDEEDVNLPDGAYYEEGEAVEGPKVLADVSLAKRRARAYPRTLEELSVYINIPELKQLVTSFLHDQTTSNVEPLQDDLPPPPCPPLDYPFQVFHSAAATFYAPSDISGIGGMRRERIRATPTWYRGPPRYDCIFAEKDDSLAGFRGLHAARVRLFFSFKYSGIEYPCALVNWFSPVSDEPDDLTGMWIVEPDFNADGSRSYGVVHLDCILRAAHLIPVYGDAILPPDFHPSQSLDAFRAFYVNPRPARLRLR
ncbi:hypothetical protein EW026_g8064 [Hermanssonia centrifuga]|uniref:Uncharacterized protein n=1 Tax=Hermanssonia centrifuga TaxID=98765 RepID=A0A4S4K5N9_9APHY|nr:hypothetical protein EW026_g8064 [Hermanssonia centrifuga]